MFSKVKELKDKSDMMVFNKKSFKRKDSYLLIV